MGLFVKEENKEEKPVEVNKENIHIPKPKPESVANVRRKDLTLCDKDTIQYVIENFPSMSIDIQGGFLNLSDILDTTINNIEDESSKVVKESRNFELSQSYRNASISIYKMVQNIQEYVSWMQKEYDKVLRQVNSENNNNNVRDTYNTSESFENINNLSNLEGRERIAIYNDFTGKEPEAFILKGEIVKVDDWNDLLVKFAEVLTKKYKDNKYINKSIKEFNISDVKSEQNDFRNTAIEILNEYKIDLDEFEIILQ